MALQHCAVGTAPNGETFERRNVVVADGYYSETLCMYNVTTPKRRNVVRVQRHYTETSKRCACTTSLHRNVETLCVYNLTHLIVSLTASKRRGATTSQRCAVVMARCPRS